MRMLTFIAVAVCLLAVPLLAQPVPDPASVGRTTGDFHGCAPEGDFARPEGAHSEPFLSALKNRDLAPDSFKAMTVTHIISDAAPLATAAGKKRRTAWTAAQRSSIAAREASGIVVTGFLAGVKKEDVEACNCHDADRVDRHVWLVARPGQKRSQSMVIEISPRMLDKHPDWPALATAAWRKGFRVRISGWRTWDQEHPEQLRERTNNNGSVTHATRATLWEIHPIHRVEVETENGDFVDVDDADLSGE